MEFFFSAGIFQKIAMSLDDCFHDVPGNVPFLMVFLYGFLNAVCWICCLHGVRRESKDADQIAVARIDPCGDGAPGSMDRGRMSMVDRLWTVIFSRTWRHGCKKEVRNWFFKTQTPAWRNHICWICSYGFVWRICTGNLSFLNPFFQTKPYFLPSRQLSSGQQSSAFAKRMGWHGWLTMADRPWPRSLILVPTWGFDENMIQYDPVIAGTGENPWTSSAMIEGMIPISLFQLRVSFCHRHVMSDDWRVISWFVEFRGASGVAGSVVQSWNIIVWYFVMGGPFAWLPGLFRIHYWWHYMKSTFCYFLPSELLYN